MVYHVLKVLGKVLPFAGAILTASGVVVNEINRNIRMEQMIDDKVDRKFRERETRESE